MGATQKTPPQSLSKPSRFVTTMIREQKSNTTYPCGTLLGLPPSVISESHPRDKVSKDPVNKRKKTNAGADKNKGQIPKAKRLRKQTGGNQ